MCLRLSWLVALAVFEVNHLESLKKWLGTPSLPERNVCAFKANQLDKALSIIERTHVHMTRHVHAYDTLTRVRCASSAHMHMHMHIDVAHAHMSHMRISVCIHYSVTALVRYLQQFPSAHTTRYKAARTLVMLRGCDFLYIWVCGVESGMRSISKVGGRVRGRVPNA